MDHTCSDGTFFGFAGMPSSRQGEGLTRKRSGVVGSSPAVGAAGMPTGRIMQLSLHTRKRTDWSMKDFSNFRNITELAHSDAPAPLPLMHKKSQLRYCGLQPEEQRQHFQTRWKPIDGKMAFCTGRRGGSATVECDYEFLDRENTYHTWKRMGDSHRNTGSHLQFDRFLTVEESAKRSDRLPEVKNRNPPVANPDGPFENPRPRGGNLDRTWVPREDAKRSDNFVVSNRPSAAVMNESGADRGDMRHGVKSRPTEDHAFDFVLPPSE